MRIKGWNRLLYSLHERKELGGREGYSVSCLG